MKKFYTIDSTGLIEIRDLEREGNFFTMEKYLSGPSEKAGAKKSLEESLNT